MRFAWFTPFSKTSSIARDSRVITKELAKLAEVDIWHPECADPYTSELPVISCPPGLRIDASMLSGYDLAVYNLGNHLPFHRQIFETSQSAPGLVILHDFVLHHFFAGLYLEKGPQVYIDAMARNYGERGRTVAGEACAGRRPPVCSTGEVADFPFFEEGIRAAWGVVVHSEFLRRRVAGVFPGPVKRLGLPHVPDGDGRLLGRAELGIPERSTLILTVGHVNPNKRIQSVIEALARLPESRLGGLLYVVAGPYDDGYRSVLEAVARKSGLEGAVRFAGYVGDDQLRSYLVHADICVNLRYPVIEGASGSVIEEMFYGKPVIVTDTGFFRELPDDCVRKVDPRHEAEELPQALRDLIANPAARREMGARAKRYATRQFRADTYAKGIAEIAGELMGAKPMLRYADRIGAILAQMGVSADMPVVETVAQLSTELFTRSGK